MARHPVGAGVPGDRPRASPASPRGPGPGARVRAPCPGPAAPPAARTPEHGWVLCSGPSGPPGVSQPVPACPVAALTKRYTWWLKTDTLSLFSLGLHAPSPKASSALVTAAPTSHGDPHTRHSCAHTPHQDPRAFPVIAVTQDHTLGSDDRPLPAPVWRPEGRARKAGLRGPGRSFLPVPPAAPDGGAGAHVLPAMLAMTTSRETLHLVTS